MIEEMDITDSDSDTSEILDIQRLKDCLSSDNDFDDDIILLNEPGTSTSTAYTKSEYATSSKVKIEIALAVNKEADETWKTIEMTVRNKLAECRQNLESMNENKHDAVRPPKTHTFRYSLCGRPYFKDKLFCSPPHNNDTIAMQNSGMIDYANLNTVTGWTLRDKILILNVVYRAVRESKRKEITSKINELSRKKNSLKFTADDQIEALQEMLRSIDTQPISSILSFESIAEEYDWEAIADQFNGRRTANECRAFWKTFVHPSLNKSTWKSKEQDLLKSVAAAHNYEDWDSIAAQMKNGRSGYQCFVYYRTHIDVTSNLKWSKQEDEYLRRLVNYYKEGNYIPWGKVAAMMENRNKMQIYTRWRNSCQPTIKKGRFFPEEDAVLLAFVKKFGLDFRKATNYVPGRTQNQLRIRHSILTGSQTSAVWTVEEDKKLLQLMANVSNSYADVAKFFPGKSRSHVRTRHLTLKKWMMTNPHKELAWAPRKGARRLAHIKHTGDLDNAVTNLNKRLHSEVKEIGKKPRVSKDSDIYVIDDAIVACLINDHIIEKNINEKDKKNEKKVKVDNTVTTQRQLNSDNLKRILFLMRGRMNRTKYENSIYKGLHPELLNCHIAEVKVRSYSRKNPVQTTPSSSLNIWNNNFHTTHNYVLPPNLSTITALKLIMAKMSLRKVSNKLHKNYSIYQLCKNEHFRQEWELCLNRFMILFTWPLILSDIQPSRDVFLFQDQEIDNDNQNDQETALVTCTKSYVNHKK